MVLQYFLFIKIYLIFHCECVTFNCQKQVDVDLKVEENTIGKQMFSLLDQAGGHHGILKDDEGRILKPLKVENELEFYETVYETTDPLFIKFKNFMPLFYGSKDMLYNGKMQKFLVLDDVTNGLEKPCVMDIKIGRDSQDPDAKLHKKIIFEVFSWTTSKGDLHFFVAGYKVYDIEKNTALKAGMIVGTIHNHMDVYNGLATFFNIKNDTKKYLLPPIIEKIKEILDWSKQQTRYHIYGSSVLFVYDASILKQIIDCNRGNENCAEKFNQDSWLRIKLIDFAHAVQAKNNSPDLNYISGLTRLIYVIEKLAE